MELGRCEIFIGCWSKISRQYSGLSRYWKQFIEVISVFSNSTQFDAELEKSYIGLIFSKVLLGMYDGKIYGGGRKALT